MPSRPPNAIASGHQRSNDALQNLHSAQQNFQELKKGVLSAAEEKELTDYGIQKKNAHGFANKALISADGNTLMLSLDGATLARKQFEAKGFFAKLFGSAPPHLLQTYRKTFDPKYGKDLDFKAETEAHLIKNLKSNHYYGQLLFKKKNGNFDLAKPDFCTITDSLYSAAKRVDPKLAKKYPDKLKKSFTIDKVIADWHSQKNDLDTAVSAIAEGITKTTDCKLLTIPFECNYSNPNFSNTVIKGWTHPLLKVDGNWIAEPPRDNSAMTVLQYKPEAEELSTIFDGKLVELETETRASSGPDPLERNKTHKKTMQQCIQANKSLLGIN